MTGLNHFIGAGTLVRLSLIHLIKTHIEIERLGEQFAFGRSSTCLRCMCVLDNEQVHIGGILASQTALTSIYGLGSYHCLMSGVCESVNIRQSPGTLPSPLCYRSIDA